MVPCQRGDAAVPERRGRFAAAAPHAPRAANGSPAGSPSARALRAARALAMATLALGTLGSARAQDAAPATAAPAAPAAAGTVEVVLRTGRVVTAAQWRGDPASGFTGRVGDDDERFAGADVLLVRGVATPIPQQT